MRILLEGTVERELEKERAYKQLDKVKWVNNIAIMPSNAERSLSRILKANGADFIIYTDEGAQGIIMSNNVPMQVKERLASALPDWFFHKKGFILAWGTSKGFKKTNSGYNSKDLADLILSVID